ncbi:unnamed protein product [Agarophyton chilense]
MTLTNQTPDSSVVSQLSDTAISSPAPQSFLDRFLGRSVSSTTSSPAPPNPNKAEETLRKLPETKTQSLPVENVTSAVATLGLSENSNTQQITQIAPEHQNSAEPAHTPSEYEKHTAAVSRNVKSQMHSVEKTPEEVADEEEDTLIRVNADTESLLSERRPSHPILRFSGGKALLAHDALENSGLPLGFVWGAIILIVDENLESQEAEWARTATAAVHIAAAESGLRFALLTTGSGCSAAVRSDDENTLPSMEMMSVATASKLTTNDKERFFLNPPSSVISGTAHTNGTYAELQKAPTDVFISPRAPSAFMGEERPPLENELDEETEPKKHLVRVIGPAFPTASPHTYAVPGTDPITGFCVMLKPNLSTEVGTDPPSHAVLQLAAKSSKVTVVVTVRIPLTTIGEEYFSDIDAEICALILGKACVVSNGALTKPSIACRSLDVTVQRLLLGSEKAVGVVRLLYELRQGLLLGQHVHPNISLILRSFFLRSECALASLLMSPRLFTNVMTDDATGLMAEVQLEKRFLKDDAVHVLDTGFNVFVYVGSGASVEAEEAISESARAVAARRASPCQLWKLKPGKDAEYLLDMYLSPTNRATGRRRLEPFEQGFVPYCASLARGSSTVKALQQMKD